jgi:hypothetical protein
MGQSLENNGKNMETYGNTNMDNYGNISRFLQMVVPQNGWFIMETPKIRWMMKWGTPILGNHHISHKKYLC